jgi:hypothetical protein
MDIVVGYDMVAGRKLLEIAAPDAIIDEDAPTATAVDIAVCNSVIVPAHQFTTVVVAA